MTDRATNTEISRLWQALFKLTKGCGGRVLYADAEREAGMPALTFEANLRALIAAKRASIGGRGIIFVIVPPHECLAPRVSTEAELARQRAKRAADRRQRERRAIAAGRAVPRRNALSANGEFRCKACHDIKTHTEFHLLWRDGRVYRDRMCKGCRTKVPLWPNIRIWTEGTAP